MKEMPPVYRCPIRTNPEPFTTNYRVFVGQGALFEKDQGIGVANVTDGTSNTIMIVEAREAVPWTKPDDLSFDPAAAPSLHGSRVAPSRRLPCRDGRRLGPVLEEHHR